MATTEKYNGWTNYETWNVALWIGNEEGSYTYWQEAARDTWDNTEADGNFTRNELAILNLSKRLKSELDDDMEEMGVPKLTGFYADLLNAALSEVNWYEIAEHMIEELGPVVV